MSGSGFVWREQTIRTNGDLRQVLEMITDREEAQAFLAAYRRVNHNAYGNIDWMSRDYANIGIGERIRRLFLAGY